MVRTVADFAAAHETGGMLILDPTEHLGQAAVWFDSGAEGVYFRSGDSCRHDRSHGNLRESRL